ncbi:MAG TPA: hypothetical protein IGS53_23035 [Leptolyngbyaceae cyanobacterium M33_DOE_097]|uniref:Uncharacterized protein n=1 Tax=Oscillatoriales cyanobacterium SpSt-418 TaxID=2282169 RepID=A0A7C3KCE3_9CYAN|nr:hypothetical protein [Leptolyngbyaceae cyanobacterium M33_DOE_097]
METLVVMVLGGIYAGGIWKFLSGFKRTNFTQNKLILALLWPVLLVNRSYRQNFTKALKG